MKIVILSTETPHHIYFINRLALGADVKAVFYETVRASFSYETSPPYAAEEDKFERENFFIKVSDRTPSSLPVHRVRSVNTDEFVDAIRQYDTDLAIVFGCGRIKPYILSLFEKRMINVHRGIVPNYRGLDSDLWAIYNEDFDNIGVTLHYVDEGLDTGDVVALERVQFDAQDKICHLRYKTTVMATDMMANVISRFSKNGLKRTRQAGEGRYYSAMPASLKSLCVPKFEKYIKDNKNKCVNAT